MMKRLPRRGLARSQVMDQVRNFEASRVSCGVTNPPPDQLISLLTRVRLRG